MVIKEAVVHGISKAAHSNEVTEHPRTQLLVINEQVERLCLELLKVYGKLSNTYGTFSNDPAFTFPASAKDYHANQQDFLSFTQTATHLIALRMGESSAATGGYVFFVRYENQGKDWLLIAMLKIRTATGIDPSTLELNDASAFDVEHLHEAARVDLERWDSDAQPYLSFIKKGRQDEVTRYFRNAIGCTDYTDSKAHTTQAREALERFCKEHQMTAEQKQTFRGRFYDYCEERRRSNEPVVLDSLSAALDSQDPSAFKEYVRANGYAVNDTFSPHRDSYRGLKRIQAVFDSVRISFDVQDVISERIDLGTDGSSIVIRNVPEKYTAEIKKAKGNDPSDGSS